MKPRGHPDRMRPAPPPPELVAHRGHPREFPENTLPSFASALALGIRWLELDVQLSADGVPFVVHDAQLDRTTTATGDVRELPASLLDDVDACEPRRFGERFSGTALPRLSAFASLLAAHPGARAFIELKRASLERHGRERCIDSMAEALGPVSERCIPISFDLAAVRMARERTGLPVGWVLPAWTSEILDECRGLAPDFAFVDDQRLPPGDTPLPTAAWRWAVYEVESGRHALALAARGVALVETMAARSVLAELAQEGLA
jgi:glycerophosphoryl diester phosphodiesterase